MIHTWHMGEWVKQVLEDRHINTASVARAMGVTTGAFHSYFKSAVLQDETLRKMSTALKFDIFTMVKQEQARLLNGDAHKAPDENSSVMSEPPARYGRVKVGSNPDAWLMTLNMDDFADDVQLKIVRFIQQLPRRGQKAQVG